MYYHHRTDVDIDSLVFYVSAVCSASNILVYLPCISRVSPVSLPSRRAPRRTFSSRLSLSPRRCLLIPSHAFSRLLTPYHALSRLLAPSHAFSRRLAPSHACSSLLIAVQWDAASRALRPTRAMKQRRVIALSDAPVISNSTYYPTFTVLHLPDR